MLRLRRRSVRVRYVYASVGVVAVLMPSSSRTGRDAPESDSREYRRYGGGHCSVAASVRAYPWIYPVLSCFGYVLPSGNAASHLAFVLGVGHDCTIYGVGSGAQPWSPGPSRWTFIAGVAATASVLSLILLAVHSCFLSSVLTLTLVVGCC